MTDKELRRLKRTELLELMYYLQKELDDVKKENEALRSQLEAHAAGQVDVNREILETVQRSAAQIETLCKAKGLDSGKKPKSSDKKEMEQ